MNSFFWVSGRAVSVAFLVCSTGMLVGTTGCGKAPPEPAGSAAAPASGTPSDSATGPIDVCEVVTPDVVTTILGPLPAQPPSKSESVGFGIYQCLYIGPKRSGEGAQTIFSQLSVSAGSGKDAPFLLQNDADKRHAVVNLSGVGDEAKRSADGSFVWAKQGGLYCTAQISNGLPAPLTADSAATQLAGLCTKVFSKVKR